MLLVNLGNQSRKNEENLCSVYYTSHIIVDVRFSPGNFYFVEMYRKNDEIMSKSKLRKITLNNEISQKISATATSLQRKTNMQICGT